METTNNDYIYLCDFPAEQAPHYPHTKHQRNPTMCCWQHQIRERNICVTPHRADGAAAAAGARGARFCLRQSHDQSGARARL